MCDAAHGVRWLLSAALGMTLVAVHPALSRADNPADNPGHSIAEKFATDAEKAKQRRERAAKAKHNSGEMMRLQPLARQQGGKHDEEQGPEIGEKAHLYRRRIADGREIDEVIAEQPRHTERPDAPVLE